MVFCIFKAWKRGIYTRVEMHLHTHFLILRAFLEGALDKVVRMH